MQNRREVTSNKMMKYDFNGAYDDETPEIFPSTSKVYCHIADFLFHIFNQTFQNQVDPAAYDSEEDENKEEYLLELSNPKMINQSFVNLDDRSYSQSSELSSLQENQIVQNRKFSTPSYKIEQERKQIVYENQVIQF